MGADEKLKPKRARSTACRADMTPDQIQERLKLMHLDLLLVESVRFLSKEMTIYKPTETIGLRTDRLILLKKARK